MKSHSSEPDETTSLLRAMSSFGGKNISTFSSYALLVNNAVGPAILIYPLLNASAGWLSPIVLGVFVYVVSTFACVMLCEAIQRIPGNQHFHQRIEFCDVVRHYLGDRWYWIAQVSLALSLQASNIAAMIVSSQVVDNLVVKVFGRSYAINWMTFSSETTHGSTGHFPDSTVISVGFLLCMAICIPFGYVSLEDNIGFQQLSFWALLFFTGEFILQFFINITGESHFLPVYENDMDTQITVLGTLIFANAFVVTLPSWLNEKKRDVEVSGLVWNSLGFATVFRSIVGVLGALAFSLTHRDDTGVYARSHADNILNFLVRDDNFTITQYSSLIWDILTIIPGIPVLAVVMKYNLMSGNILSESNAFLFAVVFPWAVTAFCYEASILPKICAWAGLLIQGYINFAMPCYLYIKCLQAGGRAGGRPRNMSHHIHALPRSWSLETKVTVAWVILAFFVLVTTICILKTLIGAFY